MDLMPQEIEVWYVLPSLRRALALELVKAHRMPQVKVAGLLGVTESAVSQYVSAKRAKGISLTNEVKAEIQKAASRLAAEKSSASEELYNICMRMRKSGSLCPVHKGLSKTRPSCTMCLER